jgi:hypothetical protein
MSFLAPGWLGTAVLGLLAAAVPIIIHFLFKTRYRVVPWAAMQFLRKSLEKTTRRLRFQELLLLLLRIGLLLLLALALMRPSSARQSGQAGAPVDAIFILDTSGSMAIREDGQTRLEQAKAAALRILDSLPPQSTLRILHAATTAEDLGPASATNRDQAKFILQQLEQTHAAAPLLDALHQAKDILSRGSFANKEVYLFSDMQRQSWDQEGPALSVAWAELQQLGEVILVQAGHGSIPANATLLNLRPQVALPLPGQRVPFSVEVRNTGQTDLQGLTVTLRSNDNERESDTLPVPPLKPGETAAVTLGTRLERQGSNTVSAELQGDQLAIDNRLDFILETRSSLKVLVIDGQWNEADPARSASYYLAHALRSAQTTERSGREDPLQLTVIPPASAYPAQLADEQICFLVGLGQDQNKLPAEFLERLSAFAQSGGGVIFFAGHGGASTGLESWSGLPCTLGNRFTQSEQQPLTYDILSISDHSPLSAFRHAPLNHLGQTETTRGRSLTSPKKDAQVLLQFSNGQSALVSQRQGQGLVIVSATAADLEGTDAPLRPSYVPLIQTLVSMVLSQQSGQKNLLAGKRHVWSPPLDQARQRFRLLQPNGLYQSLGVPRLIDQRPEITTTSTSRAGIYRILPETAGSEETSSDAGAISNIFAVVPDPSETADLTTLSKEQLSERFPRTPIFLAANQLTTEALDRSRIQREWSETMFWIVLVWCLGELAFSWFCNRSI